MKINTYMSSIWKDWTFKIKCFGYKINKHGKTVHGNKSA